MLRAILDPWSETRPESLVRQRIVALALTGDIAEAGQLLVAERSSLTTTESALAEAAITFVSSDSDGADPFLTLLRGRASEDLRAAACTLALVALQDEGRLGEALALADSEASAVGSVGRQILALHRAVLLGRLGRTDEAYEQTQRLTAEAHTGPLGDLVNEVATRNHVSIAFQAGVHVPWTRPPRSGVLDSIEGALASGLNVFARNAFDSATEMPGSRKFTWSATDPVRSPLEVAHRQSKVIADLSLSRDTARLLGRYLYMAAAESKETIRAIGLMRSAQDVDAVKRAVWMLWSRGPLGTLKRMAEQTLESEWHPHDVRANHAIVAQAASLLSQRQASDALRLLRDSLKGTAHRPRPMDGDPDGALLAIARLIPFASPKEGSATAGWIFTEIQDANPRDAMFLQAAPRVVEAIDWERVAQGTIDRWVGYADRYLGEPVDHTFVARAVAVRLARAGVTHAQRRIEDEFKRKPSIASVALLLRAGIGTSNEMKQALITVATEALDEVRSNAERGQYSIGGYDVGAIAADLALDTSSDAAWRPLVRFIGSPAVAAESKEGAISRLLQSPDRIPPGIAVELAKSAADLTAPEVPLLSEGDSLSVLRLQLGLAVGGFSGPDVLNQLLDLASGTLVQRVAAAQLLPAASLKVGSEVGIVLALQLTASADASVAGAACRSLTQLAPDARRDLVIAAAKTVAEVAAGPGALKPLETIRALTAGAKRGRNLLQAMRRSLDHIARNHPDGWVRRAARAAIQQAGN